MGYEGRRCNSECYYPDHNSWFMSKTCRERSHGIVPNNGSCPPTYFYCLVATILPILSQKQRCLRAWTRVRREGVVAMGTMNNED